jgi:hypothetical protein
MDIVYRIVNAKPTERSCDDVLDGTKERGIVKQQARVQMSLFNLKKFPFVVDTEYPL